MIKLATRLEGEQGRLSTTFYFRNMKDCNAFKYVFSDYGLTIPWAEPIDVPESDVDVITMHYADESPTDRAKANIFWGFKVSEMVRDSILTITPPTLLL